MKKQNITDWPVKRRKVGKVLDRNRTLLKALRKKEDVSTLADRSFTWLKGNGFDFNYHTHIESLPDGRIAVMCYEEGYVLEYDGVSLFSPPRASLLS